MRTTLYEKLFIDGFHKPSYVVATLALDRLPLERELVAAVVRTIEHHPRLRSLVRNRFGVPVALVARPAREWIERGGLRVLPSADIHALEEELLGTAMDLRRATPLELHLVREPATLVVKIHHAVIDATSGFALLHDFARILAGFAPIERARRTARSWRRATDWLKGVHVRSRVPEVSVVAKYRPVAWLDREPVAYTERVLPNAHARIVRTARRRGATFFELLASALLSAMNEYNVERSSSPPREVGLMFARARPRSTQREVSFSADTCVVSVPAEQLASPHDPATLHGLRQAARDRRHNDLALAALYATRKVRGKGNAEAPSEQRALHFTLSDVTAFGRTPRQDESGLAINDMRVLASPTSFDHAGMVVSRFGDDLRLSIVSHRGAVDADALLSATLRHLEDS